jgi:hypothetical protein
MTEFKGVLCGDVEDKLDLSVCNDPDAGMFDTDDAVHIDEKAEAELAKTLKEAQAH